LAASEELEQADPEQVGHPAEDGDEGEHRRQRGDGGGGELQQTSPAK
jgi:hypothetical protein